MTNCINCGAPLQGNQCEYCGTKYNLGAVFAEFQNTDYMGTFKVDGEEIKVYISSMESRAIGGEPRRDSDGILHRDKPKMKRKFTLVEI